MIPAGSRYVAMGSSYAAGPQLRPRSPHSPLRAARSNSNYAHLVARRLDLDLADVSYSGATAAQMIDGKSDRPAQIEAVTAETQLVTLTCGGNDVEYIGRLVMASLPRRIRSLPPLRRYISDAGHSVDTHFAQLPATFDRLLAEVHQRAPQATVVLVDYLTLLPPGQLSASPLPSEVVSWGRDVADRLARETAAAASRSSCLLIEASAASSEHHAWSAQPWTTRFQLRLDRAIYHPNYDGMKAVADLLVETLS
jgi:lysophospholipase L1-like esterase